eukprot:Awhi_evm1s12450
MMFSFPVFLVLLVAAPSLNLANDVDGGIMFSNLKCYNLRCEKDFNPLRCNQGEGLPVWTCGGQFKELPDKKGPDISFSDIITFDSYSSACFFELKETNPAPFQRTHQVAKQSFSTDSGMTASNSYKISRKITDGDVYCTFDVQQSPIIGVWNSWGAASQCSKTCGDGTQTRTRICNGPFFGGSDCPGDRTSISSCNIKACPVVCNTDFATEDDAESSCSTSSGVSSFNADSFNGDCKYQCFSNYIKTSCGSCSAPVNGKWSAWGSTGSCSRSCGTGSQSMIRSCTNPAPANSGSICDGPSTKSDPCNSQACPIVPVNGKWSSWASTGSCSKSCGAGSQSMTRSCTNPAPVGSGSTCSGPSTKSDPCNPQICPIAPVNVNGKWSAWASTGSCSKSCGTGSQSMTRSCTNPTPAGSGSKCSGPSTKSDPCNSQTCPIAPVNGKWSAWAYTGSCSKSCGTGSQPMTRSCTNPVPAGSGSTCSGSSAKSGPCNPQTCPIAPANVNGKWSAWTSVHSCTKSCGTGTQTMSRSCTNPTPVGTGSSCEGLPTKSASCNSQTCPIAPVNGKWSSWASIGSCSKSCGTGSQSMTRSCTNPVPANSGLTCSGSSTKSDTCNTQACTTSGTSATNDGSTNDGNESSGKHFSIFVCTVSLIISIL